MIICLHFLQAHSSCPVMPHRKEDSVDEAGQFGSYCSGPRWRRLPGLAGAPARIVLIVSQRLHSLLVSSLHPSPPGLMLSASRIHHRFTDGNRPPLRYDASQAKQGCYTFPTDRGEKWDTRGKLPRQIFHSFRVTSGTGSVVHAFKSCRVRKTLCHN